MSADTNDSCLSSVRLPHSILTVLGIHLPPILGLIGSAGPMLTVGWVNGVTRLNGRVSGLLDQMLFSSLLIFSCSSKCLLSGEVDCFQIQYLCRPCLATSSSEFNLEKPGA